MALLLSPTGSFDSGCRRRSRFDQSHPPDYATCVTHRA
jgi:hypothetical protein